MNTQNIVWTKMSAPPDWLEAHDNAVWTYELPKTDVGEIGSHLAFYPDKVEITRGG